uniref:Uncharacterized protein n=1 Tax=Globodera rostochiensis TaxID=31243 RepID=A0A914GSR5_GLORO
MFPATVLLAREGSIGRMCRSGINWTNVPFRDQLDECAVQGSIGRMCRSGINWTNVPFTLPPDRKLATLSVDDIILWRSGSICLIAVKVSFAAAAADQQQNCRPRRSSANERRPFKSAIRGKL